MKSFYFTVDDIEYHIPEVIKDYIDENYVQEEEDEGVVLTDDDILTIEVTE